MQHTDHREGTSTARRAPVRTPYAAAGPRLLGEAGPPLRGASGPRLLSQHVSRQLRRLLRVSGAEAHALTYQLLVEQLLGAAARQPLSAGPVSPSFISDDHTPAEFSLTFPRGRDPLLRILLEPGSGTTTWADNGRAGLRVLRQLTQTWNVRFGQLDLLKDIFLPSKAQGPFALWCAMELRPDGRPGFKIYLNPCAHGPGRATEAVEEALDRLGFANASPGLRQLVSPRSSNPGDFVFVSLDVGAWTDPRVKVYVRHRDATGEQVAAAARLMPGPHPEAVAAFCHQAVPTGRFTRLPVLSCYSYTTSDTHSPSGHAIHLPVRAYAPDDQATRDLAVNVLRNHGIRHNTLDRALTALGPHQLSSSVGLISYLSLTHTRCGAARATAYLSSEAYRTTPPQHAPAAPTAGRRPRPSS